MRPRRHFNRTIVVIIFLASFAAIPVSAATATAFQFSKNLQLHDTGPDVLLLQQFLNAQGFPVAQTGPGSPGSETTTFGLRTYRALARLQAAHELPATGFFGPLTRNYVSHEPVASITAPNTAAVAPPKQTTVGISTLPATASTTSNTNTTTPWIAPVSISPGFGGGGGDTTPPVISGTPSNITAEATSASGATVNYTAPTAADNVDGTDSVSCSPASGTVFALSTTTVTCSATDRAGNSSQSTFSVTVRDTTPPTVSLTVPSSGATVSGPSVTLTATASDSVAIAGVTFKVNGVIVGSEDTSSPYSVSWDSTATSSGSKSIVAIARDTSGNLATSSAVTVTVPPVISSISSGTPAQNSATITWLTDEGSDSQINYGVDASYGATTTLNSTLTTSHSVGLTGLATSTTYHYRVRSTDAQGNLSVSSDQTFTTNYDTASLAVFAAMTTPPSTSRKVQIDTLIRALENAGIWSRLDALYVLAAADSQAARINWIAPGTFTASVVGSPVFTADVGYAGTLSAADYLDTGFNPTTATSPHYTQNDESMLLFLTSDDNQGGSNVGNSSGSIQARTAGDAFFARSGATTNNAITVNGVNPNAIGYYATSRTGSADFNGFLRGGNAIPIVQASTALSNQTFTITGRNGAASDLQKVGVFGFGGSITQAQSQAANAAFSAYLTSIGVALPIVIGSPSAGVAFQTTGSFTADFTAYDGTTASSFYWAMLSPWNKDGLANGTDYTESVTINNGTFPNGVSHSWSWPNVTASFNVYAYGGLFFGAYGPINPPHVPTPIKVANLNTLTFQHNISISGNTDQFDVIYDGFLSSSPSSYVAADEFSIAVHSPSYLTSYVNGLSPLTYTDTNGTVWKIAKVTSKTPNQILAIPSADILNYTIDFKAMLSFMVTNGLLTGNEYFIGTGFGVEPQKNAGTLNVTTFNVTMN